MSWSSGKDSAWALHHMMQAGEVELVGLITTLNESAHRVAMHGVRRSLLEMQAQAIGLPLIQVDLPAPCTNVEYQQRIGTAFTAAKNDLGVSQVIFGDLFLQDIRKYREKQMANLSLTPLFPLFDLDSTRLAHDMLDGGLEAVLTCVDTQQLDQTFSGRSFDARLIEDLPNGVDPCGENGEFHTLVTDAPMFRQPIPVIAGKQHDDGRFMYTDFEPA